VRSFSTVLLTSSIWMCLHFFVVDARDDLPMVIDGYLYLTGMTGNKAIGTTWVEKAELTKMRETWQHG
jgi:hypothetical protein